MSIEFEFSPGNLDAKLGEINEKIRRNVKREIGRIGLSIKGRAQQNLRTNGQVDTGGLWSSVYSEVSEDGMAVFVGTRMKLGLWIERGTQPHGVSKEGRENIAKWAERKLGANPDDAEAIANAIAWKIYHYGSKAKPWLFPALESERANVKNRLVLAVQEGMK